MASDRQVVCATDIDEMTYSSGTYKFGAVVTWAPDADTDYIQFGTMFVGQNNVTDARLDVALANQGSITGETNPFIRPSDGLNYHGCGGFYVYSEGGSPSNWQFGNYFRAGAL